MFSDPSKLPFQDVTTHNRKKEKETEEKEKEKAQKVAAVSVHMEKQTLEARKREKAPKERSLPFLVTTRRASKKEKAQGMPQWLQVEASSPQQANQLLRRLQPYRTMNIRIVKHRRPLKQTNHGLITQRVGSTILPLLRPCLGLRTNHGMQGTATLFRINPTLRLLMQQPS